MQHPAFDLYAGLFTVGEVAVLTGVSRPVVDVWLARGVVSPTRREKPSGRKPRPRVRASARRGRPLFSCRDVFKVALARLLFDRLSLSSTDTKQIQGVEATKLLDGVAGGEWMHAVARSIEREKPITIYAYATRQNRRWQIDAHVGATGAAPCFGWGTPHLFVPMSVLFSDVYRACRELLAGSSETDERR